MIRDKPAKINLKSLKNNLIQSRSHALKLKPEINSSPISLVYPPSDNYQQPQQKTHKSTLQMNSDNSTTSQKRLKLKDYIHLNSLQKRRRSDSLSSQTHHNISLKQKQESVKLSQQEYVCTLKKEIQLKIAHHRVQLQQIDTFLKEDFTGRESRQTFLFLFSIYNTINDMQKMDRGIGEKIVEFEAKQMIDSRLRVQKHPYFWRREKQLDSPAKILKNALKITFDLTNFLQIAE